MICGGFAYYFLGIGRAHCSENLVEVQVQYEIRRDNVIQKKVQS